MALRCGAEAAGMGRRGSPPASPLAVERGLDRRRQVIAGHRVPERQQPQMQVERAGMVARRGCVPEGHAGPGRGRQDRRDRAVGPEREGGIQQRIDRAQDARALGGGRHQVGEQLEVAGALLDAGHARYAGHDLDQQSGREVGPGHDIVDDDGRGDGPGHLAEMLFHMRIVRPEEVMHGRDLQRGRARFRRRPAALDGLGGGIDDDAGDDGRAPVRFLDRDGRQPADLFRGERMALAGAARDRDGRQPADLFRGERMALAGAARDREAVDAGVEQEARLRPERRLVNAAIRRERRRHGRRNTPDRVRAELSHCLPPCRRDSREGLNKLIEL